MVLTIAQRDFLDHYYVELSQLTEGETIRLARDYGFTVEHFNRLWDCYLASWGDLWGRWPERHPPVSQHPVFPWSSIQELEDQLDLLGIPIAGLK